jgi:tyrosyl-tRNA synthetase
MVAHLSLYQNMRKIGTMEIPKDLEKLLTRSVEEIIVKESLIKRLTSGKKLVIKLGIDPTGSQLHLGHAVVLRKLRDFQELGHQAVLVIGDFTAKIGDPSGRTQERKALTNEQVKKNMESYKEQAGKVLDLKKIKFAYNSEWLEKMGLKGMLELASKATIAQIMERKEFKERVKSDVDIPYLEMFYPLMQGYDSVALKADVELGGTDQKFNLLMGRQIQKRYDQKEQEIMMMKLLPGTDGAKMSKSAENYIPLIGDPFDMYGKVMSVSDELLPTYFELCTDIPLKSIDLGDPFKAKKKLARTLVETYHNIQIAQEAEENFEKVFSKGKYQETQSVSKTIPAGFYKRLEIPIVSGSTTSTVQAKNLWRNNAIEINGKVPPTGSWTDKIELKPGDLIKIGAKRIIKVE